MAAIEKGRKKEYDYTMQRIKKIFFSSEAILTFFILAWELRKLKKKNLIKNHYWYFSSSESNKALIFFWMNTYHFPEIIFHNILN